MRTTRGKVHVINTATSEEGERALEGGSRRRPGLRAYVCVRQRVSAVRLLFPAIGANHGETVCALVQGATMFPGRGCTAGGHALVPIELTFVNSARCQGSTTITSFGKSAALFEGSMYHGSGVGWGRQHALKGGGKRGLGPGGVAMKCICNARTSKGKPRGDRKVRQG